METKNIDVKRFSNKFLNHGDNIRKVTTKVAKDLVIPDRGDSIKTGAAFTKTIDAKNDGNTRNIIKKVTEKYKNISPFKVDDKNNLESKINHKDTKDDQKQRSEETTTVKNNEKVNQKVPLIKTLKSKNDTKFYNITFKEPKQQKTLRINIPSVNQKSSGMDKVPKKSSKTNITKRIQRFSSPILTKKASPPTEISKWSPYSRHEKRIQRFSSPILTKKASPPTEISKWSPYSRHEKSYYEAWVNFASIPKNTSKSLAKDVVKFQKQLERLDSSELVYESFTDEKFTGKIKVNHR